MRALLTSARCGKLAPSVPAALFRIDFVAPGISQLLSLRPESSSMIGAILLAAEIACRGTGKLLVHESALDRLEALRDRLGNWSVSTNFQRLMRPPSFWPILRRPQRRPRSEE